MKKYPRRYYTISIPEYIDMAMLPGASPLEMRCGTAEVDLKYNIVRANDSMLGIDIDAELLLISLLNALCHSRHILNRGRLMASMRILMEALEDRPW
jgi:hypothetical protein